MTKRRTLYWFTHDLRLQDNVALAQAMHHSAHIAFVYIVDTMRQPYAYCNSTIKGEKQQQFINQSLVDLRDELHLLGYDLSVQYGDTQTILSDIIINYQIDNLVCAQQVGYWEQQQVKLLAEKMPSLTIERSWQHTLFTPEQVSFDRQHFASFSCFRKYIEQQLPDIHCGHEKINRQSHSIKLNIGIDNSNLLITSSIQTDNLSRVAAGEKAAHQHLSYYFSGELPARYKETRNALDGFHHSTKLSAYLAIGSLSPKQIWLAVENYEQQVIKNESTYWIKFELLWREYFQWLSYHYGSKLFCFSGLNNTKPLTSFYAERFQKWQQGNTPFALVNACIKQLNNTGFLSNRGRQIVASCLVNELAIDWRYGAGYFQQALLDHDVASNWGNWQYIAGVGVDPRGGRHFNIERQALLYDKQGAYVKRWQGNSNDSLLDSTDITDWPIHAGKFNFNV